MTTQQLTPYPRQQLAAQPIGYWTGAAHREVVGRIRKELATESLTQPHWWILNHVAASPAHWTRAELAAKLTRYDDQGIDFDEVFADLASRGWLTEDATGTLTLTAAGEAAASAPRNATSGPTSRHTPGSRRRSTWPRSTFCAG